MCSTICAPLYEDTPPEFVYFKTLYHVFEQYLKDQSASGMLDERTGFFDSEVWNKLYAFQKDGVKGAINKVLKHGGCIIADSVGLGKTCSALAVIKYHELLNKNVLVLCPKKLAQNWTVYQSEAEQQAQSLQEGPLPVRGDEPQRHGSARAGSRPMASTWRK